MPLAKTNALVQHDIFNIVILTFITLLNFNYLIHATDISLIGTPYLGANHTHLFHYFYYSFIAYLLADTLWISVIPKSTVTGPLPIVFHHILVLMLSYVPYEEPQFNWFMASSLLVEINTILLAIKRYLPINSLQYNILNIIFYATWILMRLICFPILTWFYISEYHRVSAAKGTYVSVAVLGPLVQGLVTILNYKWSYDMLHKALYGKKKVVKKP